MKISTKARYGIKALIDLAVHSHTDQVALKAIAERQNISERYLEQVFSTLRKAGLVKSIKGPSGGYLLAVEPHKTSLYEVITALEGFETFSEAPTEKGSEKTTHLDVADLLVDKMLWQPLDLIIKEQLQEITLEALIKAYSEATQPQNIMFYI